MSLSKEECQDLFVFFNNKERTAVSQMTRAELLQAKGEMGKGLGEGFRKLAAMFKDVEELVLAKIFCQNRGNLSDTQLDVRMYLQSNPLEKRLEEERRAKLAKKAQERKAAERQAKIKEAAELAKKEVKKEERVFGKKKEQGFQQQNQASKEEISKEVEEIVQEERPKEEFLKQESIREETIKEEIIKVEAPKVEAAKVESLKQETQKLQTKEEIQQPIKQSQKSQKFQRKSASLEAKETAPQPKPLNFDKFLFLFDRILMRNLQESFKEIKSESEKARKTAEPAPQPKKYKKKEAALEKRESLSIKDASVQKEVSEDKASKMKSEVQIQTMKVIYQQNAMQTDSQFSVSQEPTEMDSLKSQICSILNNYQEMKERIQQLEEELCQYKQPLQSALQVRGSSNFVINAAQLQKLLKVEYQPKNNRK